MHIQVGLENEPGQRSLAWALDFPGCFAYGEDGSSALVALAAEFVRYKNWVASHTSQSWLDDIRNIDVRLSEVWEVYRITDDYDLAPDGRYSVNAWFRHDWKPLTRLEIQHGLALLSFSRADLLQILAGLSDEILDREYHAERWSIRGIARHLAGAEWWYLDRLDLAGMHRRELPDEIHPRLEVVRQRLLEVLPGLEGVEKVLGADGELWSPRKLLRRAIWHELDHVGHIRQLLALPS